MNRTLLCCFAVVSTLFIPALKAGTVIWNLGANPGQTWTQGQGFTSSSETVNIFAEQVNASGVIQTTPATYFGSSTLCSGGTTSGTCLFSVTAGVSNNLDTGIAPYSPAEGGSPYNGQQGIAEGGILGSNSNVLYIELGSTIASGSTVSFLLQAGDQNSASVSAFYDDTSSPFNLGAGGVTQVGGAGKDYSIITSKTMDNAAGTLTTSNTSAAQFSITKNTAGNEFIAIEADCTYILLDQIAVTSAAAPEPRFYGMLLFGFLALAVQLRRRFNAQERSL